MNDLRDQHSFLYIECDIEPGVTLNEYRRSRPNRTSRRKQFAIRVRGLARLGR